MDILNSVSETALITLKSHVVETQKETPIIEDSVAIELLNRLQANTVKEVILATNTNLEGEQTAMYLSSLITPLNIKVTRLARGLAVGGHLEFTSKATLADAMTERKEM